MNTLIQKIDKINDENNVIVNCSPNLISQINLTSYKHVFCGQLNYIFSQHIENMLGHIFGSHKCTGTESISKRLKPT